MTTDRNMVYVVYSCVTVDLFPSLSFSPRVVLCLNRGLLNLFLWNYFPDDCLLTHLSSFVCSLLLTRLFVYLWSQLPPGSWLPCPHPLSQDSDHSRRGSLSLVLRPRPHYVSTVTEVSTREFLPPFTLVGGRETRKWDQGRSYKVTGLGAASVPVGGPCVSSHISYIIPKPPPFVYFLLTEVVVVRNLVPCNSLPTTKVDEVHTGDVKDSWHRCTGSRSWHGRGVGRKCQRRNKVQRGSFRSETVRSRLDNRREFRVKRNESIENRLIFRTILVNY